ncbi:unnamed protein product [Cuscuta europaea]|uniref:Retrovirus-related Pol polyprotein from transposon TNT 1-94-like beta-barrel domain-containing protein n=1 Tax=Cuscuta europaea TaxID=41803 RepID=A0A9P0Z6V0_CUSEU|nr:unnamed protein product [Cuscuta europaea]
MQQQFRGPPSPQPMGIPGTSLFENNFGSVPPPIVYQICHSPGHSAVNSPSRFGQPSAPALAVPTRESSSIVWYPDSGASAHITPNEGILENKSIYSGPLTVTIANGSNLPLVTVGELTFSSPPCPLHLKSVFHVPNLKYNLLSIQKLCADKNCYVIFYKNSVCIKDHNSGEVLFKASNQGGVYPIPRLFLHPLL